jgi:hypothetical protein
VQSAKFFPQLSPRIARWVSETFGFGATPARNLNLRESEDAVAARFFHALDARPSTLDNFASFCLIGRA